MEKLSQNLAQFIIEACQHPPGSRERQKKLTKIITLVSRKLWQENTSYYEDALQETWVYFCKNICPGESGRSYDADKASVVTWLNSYLKWRLKDAHIRFAKQNKQTISIRLDESGESNLIDNLPAKPDVSPLIDEIERWALQDPQNKLKHIFLDSHPHITSQALILKRLPPETSWKQLAKEYGVSAGTLSSFYQRKCKPLLREFSKSQGHL